MLTVEEKEILKKIVQIRYKLKNLICENREELERELNTLEDKFYKLFFLNR